MLLICTVPFELLFVHTHLLLCSCLFFCFFSLLAPRRFPPQGSFSPSEIRGLISVFVLTHCMTLFVAEMNDTTSEKGSCLAITEKKKTQRPGGCIGIFFQLFDWNRRLTKKKLFSKKLLPPARAKQVSSKSFKGDEKMPNSKLHLIANENHGGFPSAKKGGNRVIEVEKKHEMRAPGLVARLMGLEAVPASLQDKSKKASFSDTCSIGEKESSCNHSNEVDKQAMDFKMGVAKHDPRPQKLQKMGTYERRAVTRFGAEALQIKSVLSRARKYNYHLHHHHHHSKIASPLKSPRITSGKSASRSCRLIGTATRILEPGLQATSRAKYSLTSISTPKNGIVTEKVGTGLADIQTQSDYDASIAKSFMGHTSCQNCGNLLVVDCRTEVKAQPDVPPPVVSDVFTASSVVSGQKGRSFTPFHEHDVVLLRSQEKKLRTLVNQEEGKCDVQSCNDSTTRRMPLFCEGPAKWNSSSQPCRALEDEASSFGFKHKTQTQEHMLSSEKISSGSRISNLQAKRVSSAACTANGTKDFVALNRSLNGQTRIRSPTKVDSSKFDQESKPCSRQDVPLSQESTLERKRRNPQVEGTASVNSVAVKQRNLSSDAHGGKKRDYNASSPNSSIVKSKRGVQQKADKVNDNKVNEAVSFTFNPPFKQKTVLPSGNEDISSDNKMKKYFQRPLPLTEDALGAFLEQKLKELNTQEDGKLATGGPSEKPTAIILQELISALSSEHLTCPDDHMFTDKYEVNQERLIGTSCDGNHLSPGSVLEASFSSSSLDESSGHGFHPDSMNRSPDKLKHSADLLDSATSFNKGKMGCDILVELVNQIPRILQGLNSSGTRLTKSKLIHIKDVILNAELVLGNATEHYEHRVPQLLIFLVLDELDIMVGDATSTYFNGIVGCDDFKERRRQLKGFLFDCVIEYLESNCTQYFDSVFKTLSAWTKFPLCMKAEMLVQEVKREIKKWACIAGMVPDEIIEWEMSHSLGKWTDFNVEAFEAGVDIDGDVLQILVDEIVEDLVDFRHSSI